LSRSQIKFLAFLDLLIRRLQTFLTIGGSGHLATVVLTRVD
jgi:hypothetical protein